MQPLRQILDNAPASVAIPDEFQHRRIELTIRVLDEEPQTRPRRRPHFQVANVERIEIPSREERNARR